MTLGEMFVKYVLLLVRVLETGGVSSWIGVVDD
jgi:hypothetical protein